MPALQRLRCDEEAGPTVAWENAADGGEHSAVGRFELGRDLAAQHSQLVTKHQDLQVLDSIAAGQQHEQLDGAAQGQVGESRQHAGWPPQWR
jgi:hypothetical protein